MPRYEHPPALPELAINRPHRLSSRRSSEQLPFDAVDLLIEIDQVGNDRRRPHTNLIVDPPDINTKHSQEKAVQSYSEQDENLRGRKPRRDDFVRKHPDR